MIDVNGKQVDLERALPLTFGDLRKLKERGVDLMRGMRGLEDRDAEPDTDGNRPVDAYKALALIEYLILKADPSLKQADLDAIPMSAIADWEPELERVAPHLAGGGGADPSS